MEESQEQKDNRPWLYKKGQSGNPGGRPVGSKSLKTYVREKLAVMTDEEREEYLAGVDKKIIWEMAEGKAKQDVELSGKVSISNVLDELENDRPKVVGQSMENISPVQNQEQGAIPGTIQTE